MTIKAKKSKINLREKLAELLNFRQIRDRLDGLGLYLGKDRTGSAENLAVRGGANVDDLQLAEISAILGDDAVDVFVYDTSKDSDGGKWRERTQHTSWYNEELNTATRGSRREFPAVAVIVSEGNKVTIYDGDDPDLPMWMVFNASGGNWLWYGSTGKASVMLNGKLANCAQSNARTRTIDFISDSHREYSHTDGQGSFSGGIIQRNSGSNTLSYDNGTIGLVDRTCNDVAMTVLPNAPIDSETGLPIPTIAVATNGGVSVIKDDGKVVDLLSPYTAFGNVTEISFSSDGRLHFNMYDENRPGRYFMIAGIPDKDETLQMSFEPNEDSFNKLYILDPGAQSYTTTIPKALNDNFAEKIQVLSDSRNALGSSTGLTFLDYNKNITPSINESAEGMVAYTTSKYNTGWMPGDIKLATLSDTKNETVGVDEKTELVANSGFDDDDISGWTEAGSPTITFSTPGVIDVTGDGEGLYQDIAPGTYLVSVGTISGTGGEVRFTDMDSSKQLFVASQSGDSLVITSVGNLRVYIRASGNNLASFDNISVKQTGELITNGTFDNGTTGWDQNDADSFTVNSLNQAVITSNTGNTWQSVYQGISTVIGKKYTVSVDVVGNTNLVDLWVGTSGDGSFSERSNLGPLDGNINGTGRFSATIIATTTTSFINLAVYNGIGTFDNVSVRPAEDDRSVNNNGLQIFGEITKSPVAPGADLVAYSGFSADDYLMQPYNSDLDFGTGDFYMSIWAYGGGTNQALMTREHSTTDDGGSILLFQYDNIYSFYCRQDGTATWSNSNSLTGYGSRWNHIMMVRTGGILYGYVNGKLETSFDFNGDISNNDASFYIGRRSPKSSGSNIQYFTGSLALAKIGATAPTPEQIAKIYRDEKALFTDGAQATLYGTSDAVTALAYDDKTELLHVGTSGGRSDFSGLRRINNTTTAVTTSISASNNLIAEQ
jgi:hypothetical protein